MPPAAAVPPGRAPVLPQLEPHRRTGRSLQDLGKAAGTREQDAESDQNPRPAGQAHASGNERECVSGEKQARKPERGLEIHLQRWGSRHERSPSPLSTRASPATRRRRDQTRLKISVPLAPPNPKEFDRAERRGMR